MIAPATGLAGTVAGLIRDGLEAALPRSVGISVSNAPPDRVGSLAHHVGIKTPAGPLSVSYGGGLYAIRFDGTFG